MKIRSILCFSLLVLLLAACTAAPAAVSPAAAAPVATEAEPATTESPLPDDAHERWAADEITINIDGTQVTLVDGLAEAATMQGSAEKVITTMTEFVDWGDLNEDGRDDVAFIVTQHSGGSGTFFYVASALAGGNGALSGTNGILLGDRIKPDAIRVEGGRIVVDFTDRGKDEPFTAAPTHAVKETFELAGGLLNRVLTPADLAGVWAWQKTAMNDDTVLTPDPAATPVTIQFGTDNRAEVASACGVLPLAYTIEEQQLTLEVPADALEDCEDKSMQDFVKYLPEVQTAMLDQTSGSLNLQIKYDSGSIVFNRQ